MITADQLIEIGRYNKAHGINGEISATFDCDTMAVGELSALVSPMDGIFVPFFVNGIRPKNNDTLLLPGDKAVIVADSEVIDEVRQLFRSL